MAVLPLIQSGAVSGAASGKGVVSSGAVKALAGPPPAASGGLPQPTATGTTAPNSTPINPADLDTLRLAGKLLPGVWTIEPSDVGPKLQQRGANAKGRTGAKVDADGIKLMGLSITGRFWGLSQVDDVKALLVPLVRPSNPKAIAPVAIDCWITRIYQISTVVLEDAPGPKHDGKGVYSWSIKATEFRPPVSTGAGVGSVGMNAQTLSRAQQVGLSQLLQMNQMLTERALKIQSGWPQIPPSGSAFFDRVLPPSASVPPP